jgi:hypothetical protein
MATVARTVTITDDPAAETEGAPEFSCIPMTVTNADGATLELGDDCALKYSPPESPTTTSSATVVAARGAQLSEWGTTIPLPAEVAAPLLARQAPCTPFTTVTQTQWVTVSATTTSTVSKTVAGPAGDESFSCPPMEVTNAAGDVLALDESCVLNFEPAEPTDPSPSSGSEGAGQGQNGGGGGTSNGFKKAPGSFVLVFGSSIVICLVLYAV